MLKLLECGDERSELAALDSSGARDGPTGLGESLRIDASYCWALLALRAELKR